MKGFIDTDGHLNFMRGPRFVVQLCPFSESADYFGDHCPHFGEPIKNTDTGPTLLRFSCGAGGGINFKHGDFEDKRGS